MNELAQMIEPRGLTEIYQSYGQKKKKLPEGKPVYPQYPNTLKDIFERMFFMQESQKPAHLNMTVRG